MSNNNSQNKHEIVEKNVGLMAILTVFAISFGALVEITPLMFQDDTTKPVDGLRPLTALEMEGRDIYVREGCYNCHSQMIRPFRDEVERYGHYSVAGESVWDHPFQWGSKRTGPDLARVGERYSDDWHHAHLMDPRAVVPESNMPAFPWLDENRVDTTHTLKKLQIFRDSFGIDKASDRYDGKGYGSDEELQADIAKIEAMNDGKGATEMQALIAYLQQLGTHLK
ncbi:cytochrome-c oxidase, cbb3-type subunit II [Pseudoalteromonas shioyasakiensis]|uniref:cytochrome-c oxidase, cbb3-type subunit II n=1 Tax=Pseudoalteromonas TaxID=53246 RepID=UPI000C932ADA|nr:MULTISPECIES: cytochrome-c oxidase, cbb3-type subunit II [Pseudoalteromonas]MAD04076.1 cytochrome-c oxidase, cbb3-type subunit II [Pseudoalteromonas sp.]MCG9709490.1 cytochrome-c oxidase, cbb3-type subunit II [Pseudoalteromonas sp. Isolate3]MCP4584349.1 cytochrome-c oxidase, cbb3-type subunit II [Pseudoalteromonas sp.]MCQ8881617.1 cytochrome-c oxidase, cbb3-type subunit II [Pseudoalteromonas shioyasakiensis]NIZ07002.1 cytochrome-c oxidase, cbb3-type subunit II [Pseudoalteromonas sp. HF66]|tara:strand:+ start:1401 stop:2075 length:675 start_codon:yes stop_codon:yes gene_type:complete